MSKKNRQTRRARRQGRKSRRPLKRRQTTSSRLARRNGPFTSPLDALAFGPGFRLDRIADDELELHHAYIDAHHLLPPGYPTDPDDLQRQSGRALCTLMDESAPDEAVVEALMILAHTPQERALAALEAYAAVPSRHAGLARLAAEECAMWLEDEAPLPWAVSGVLLN